MVPLLVFLLANPPAVPATAPTPTFPDDAQWAAVAACPRVVSTTGNLSRSTGVTVEYNDGFAYILTAAHAVAAAEEDREAHFFTKAGYPAPARTAKDVVVVVRLPAADVALLKVAMKDAPPVLKLAAPGRRPKAFPVPVFSVGCTDGDAPTAAPDTLRAKRIVRRPGDEVAFFWETSTPGRRGRSGGPLIDENNRVIGVCSATQDGNAYYAHLDEIQAGLKRFGYAWLYDGK